MTTNDITYQIRGAAYKVHQELGPGLLERVYQEALCYQLRKDGLSVATELSVPIVYDGVELQSDLRLDMLVEDEIIIELKSVAELQDIHKKQLLTYLKLMNKRVGLLINFNTVSLDDKAMVRIVNGY